MTCSTCAHYPDPSKPAAQCSALKLVVLGHHIMFYCSCYQRRTS